MFPFPITIFASVVPGKSFLACSQKRDNLADIKKMHMLIIDAVNHLAGKPPHMLINLLALPGYGNMEAVLWK
jgi:hypothetical protein